MVCFPSMRTLKPQRTCILIRISSCPIVLSRPSNSTISLCNSRISIRANNVTKARIRATVVCLLLLTINALVNREVDNAAIAMLWELLTIPRIPTWLSSSTHTLRTWHLCLQIKIIMDKIATMEEFKVDKLPGATTRVMGQTSLKLLQKIKHSSCWRIMSRWSERRSRPQFKARLTWKGRTTTALQIRSHYKTPSKY